MSTRRIVVLLSILVLLSTMSEGRFSRFRSRSMMRECSGSAKYRVTFYNFLSRKNRQFRNIVPRMGLVFSPMTAVTHSPRISLFTVRGFASPPVQKVCEVGANADLMDAARRSNMVSTVAGGTGGVMPGGKYTIEVTANCAYPYLTVLSMIAPSPDWVVQINNMPLVKDGRFIGKRAGYLIAYDCGTDSGRDFTNPMDTSLDIPTMPALNIAPLSEDETDRFGGRAVGFYKIERVRSRM